MQGVQMTAPRPSPAPVSRPRALIGRRAPLLWLAACLLLALVVGGLVAVLDPAAWVGAPTADRAAGPDPAQAQPPTRPFPLIEFGQHTAPIYRTGVDAQGRWLVTASHDKTARVWDLGERGLAAGAAPADRQGMRGQAICGGHVAGRGDGGGRWMDRVQVRPASLDLSSL